MNDPKIDLICNVVIRRRTDGRILLMKETDGARWWLPGQELKPYQHPDDVANEIVQNIEGISDCNANFSEIESFRGRTGWHVMFNYFAEAGEGSAESSEASGWFPPSEIPPTAHGKWERGVVKRSVEKFPRN